MELYWLLRLQHLHDFFEICAYLSIMGFILCVFLYIGLVFDEDDEEKTKIVYLPGRCLFFSALICGLLTCLIPTKSDLAIMLGWDALRSDKVVEVVEVLQKHLIEKVK